MIAKAERKAIPAYVSYRFFTSFLNELRDTGVVPQQIDSSVFQKASGSAKSAMLVSLRFLRLIEDGGKPTQLLHKLVDCPDADRQGLFKQMLDDAYPFLLNDPELHIDRASSTQVTDRFRAQEITGSTIAKAMMFFLAAAADAGIKVSHHVKAPSMPRNGAKRTGKTKREDDREEVEDEADVEDELDEEMEEFQLPIPGKKPATLSVPCDLSSDDWDLLTQMLALYVKRAQAKSKGPTE